MDGWMDGWMNVFFLGVLFFCFFYRSSSALILLIFHSDPVQASGPPSVAGPLNVRLWFLVAVGCV